MLVNIVATKNQGYALVSHILRLRTFIFILLNVWLQHALSLQLIMQKPNS